MAITGTDVDDRPNIHTTLIESLMIKEAKKYLKESLLDALDKDLDRVATEAVKGWAEIMMHQEHSMHNPLDTGNINIAFIQKIIKHIEVENPISITVKKSKEK